MGSKPVATSTLVLRIFTLFFAVTSFLLLLKNNIEFRNYNVNFKVATYRYVFYIAIIAAVYALLQIPFAIYNLKKERRRITCLLKFDFYADSLLSFLVFTGVEAGFAVTCELKHLIDHIRFEKKDGVDPKPDFIKFLNKVNVGTGLLLGAFICMIVLLVLSFAKIRNARKASDDNNIEF
ncbi:hypothetical protein SLE2022_347080 [Rubroshorea leprosula]